MPPTPPRPPRPLAPRERAATCLETDDHRQKNGWQKNRPNSPVSFDRRLDPLATVHFRDRLGGEVDFT